MENFDAKTLKHCLPNLLELTPKKSPSKPSQNLPLDPGRGNPPPIPVFQWVGGGPPL